MRKPFRKLKKLFGITDKDIRHIKRENQEAQKDIRRVIGRMIEDGSPIFEPNSTASWVVYGGAGSGKSTCVSVPAIQSMLADFERALVVNDVKSAEIAHQIAELCIKAGRKFAVIDDSYVLGKDYPYRITVNPFGNLVLAYERKSPDLLSEIETACLTILAEPDGGLDRNFFFRQVPREFMFFGILALLKRSKRNATPGGLAALMADPEILATVIDIEAEADGDGENDGENDEIIRTRARQLRTLRENDETEYSKHYLGAMSALRSFAVGSPIHDAGRDETISHEELLKGNYIVCLVQNQKNAARLGIYYGLHFNSFLSAQLNGNCGKTDIILDEAANTPAKDLIEKVTVFRAFKLRVLYIAQSRADLQRQYSDKLITTLEDNCNLQWLQFGNYEEAERVSKAIGEIDNVKVNLNAGSSNMDFTSTIDTNRERLFTPDDLMNFAKYEQILHVIGVGWIHCLKIRQNEIGDSAYYLSDNPLEGGRLTPDIKVELPFSIAEQIAARTAEQNMADKKRAGGAS